jgi:Holliday junction resolvasome RuvABC endonuclease subunit
VDYSMTSPCVCINNDNIFSFHYLTDKKKYTGIIQTNDPKFIIQGHAHKPYVNNIERFNNIASWVLSLLKTDDEIKLEGYAMGITKGLVFNIGELTGILKLRLWENNYTIESIAPTANKKAATGKGNANKDAMFNAFLLETKLDLLSLFNCNKVGNPISDIVDAYYLCNYII